MEDKNKGIHKLLNSLRKKIYQQGFFRLSHHKNVVFTEIYEIPEGFSFCFALFLNQRQENRLFSSFLCCRVLFSITLFLLLFLLPISELFIGVWVIRIPVTSGIDSEVFFSPSVNVKLREIATFFWIQVTCFIEKKDKKL